MGLTIHYTLSVKRGTLIRDLKKVLHRLARLARKNGCAHIGKVLYAADCDPDAPAFFDCAPGRERRLHGGGRLSYGWLLEVWPGEGCETAVFGIIRHRRELPRKKGQPEWVTRYSKRSDWKLDAFCKTCYAAGKGVEHFVQCHERVIQLLDAWSAAGFGLEVRDASGYWKARDRELLVREGRSMAAYLKKSAAVAV